MSKYSRAFRAFMRVKTLKPSRSVFDLSHSIGLTGDMGKLYPLPPMEMSPGDTFHVWQEMVIRMMPLNAPILHDVNVFVHWFFVPYRLLWNEWTAFITGSSDGLSDVASTGQLPAVSPSLPRWQPSSGKNGVGSLWDYLGFPTGVDPQGAYPLDFTRRAYNLIYNEYYRDENLQTPVDEDNEDILYRNWAKDYFTSALLNTQRGVTPVLPIKGYGALYTYQGNGPYTFDVSSKANQLNESYTVNGLQLNFHNIPEGLISRDIFTTAQLTVSQLDSDIGVHINVIRCTAFDPSTKTATFNVNYTVTRATGNQVLRSPFAELTVTNFENGQSVDVKDLRVAFQIQKWLELANRGGVRYTEFLRSFFGVSPRDDRLQRPEYVGGFRAPVIISEVLQTSSTNGEPTPQGNMAGHGIGATRNYVGSYTAVEYGLLMPILSIMPSAKYQQGINRQWLRRTKYDFLFPQFTGLSEQGIEQAELFATDDATQNRKVFGYNEIYDELRAIPSRIVGKLRDTFDYWHLGRKFDSAPSLNEDFIKCNPSKRIFASTSEDGFILTVGNLIRAVRPIPKYGTPKGV